MSQFNNDIRLILFSGKYQRTQKKIYNIIKKIFPEEQINVHTTLENFLSYLREPDYSQRIFLIISNTQKDLSNILLFKNLLDDQHLILILPDTAQKTMSQAYKLYPRYISHVQSDFADVANVLEKMISNFQQKQRE